MQKGILTGVNEIIDEILEVQSIGKTSPHYRHKEACDHLHRAPMKNFTADLLTEIYAQIETNWEKRLRKNPPSEQNWRFKPEQKIAPQNKSLEIQLQRHRDYGITNVTNIAPLTLFICALNRVAMILLNS